MKKQIYSIWVKVIATILCAICMFGSVWCIALWILHAKGLDKEDILKWGYERIAMNYSAYLLEQIDLEDSSSFKVLNETNMEYGIISTYENDINNIDLKNHELYLCGYSTPGYDYEYHFISMQEKPINYQIKSLWGALLYRPKQMAEAKEVEAARIYDIIMDENRILYYETDKGYIPLQTFQLDGRTYQLTTQRSDYIYDMSYVDEIGDYLDGANIMLSGGRVQVEGLNGITINLMDTFISSDVTILDKAGYIEDNYYVFAEEYVDRNYCILTHINEDKEHPDLLQKWEKFVNAYISIEANENYLLFGILMALLCLGSGAILVCTCGHRKEDSQIHLRICDKIPFLLYLFIMGGLLYLAIYWGIILVLPFLIIAFCIGVLVRIKSGKFWNYTVIFLIQKYLSLFWMMLLLFVVITIAEMFIIANFAKNMPMHMVIGIIVGIKFIEVAFGIYILFQMFYLHTGMEQIGKGNLKTVISTRPLLWAFRKHGKNLNKIAEGITIAVEEQIKSENFKTELITNVSHDIKTPLTSIISYTDIMKKENIQGERIPQYLQELELQSIRLKKLIEDLLDAAKATTKNLSVYLEECDIALLLIQAIGEFEERAHESQLELVVEHPNPPVHIVADGRYLWKVFYNLLDNICKYSLPGTRAYICLKENDNNVEVVFKNISKKMLNISEKQLQEHLIENKEWDFEKGSGLGLSIAQSLAELMNGSMKLTIDGDLFKVKITLLKSSGVMSSEK